MALIQKNSEGLKGLLNRIRGIRRGNNNKGRASDSNDQIVTRNDYISLIQNMNEILPDPDIVLQKLGLDLSAYKDTIIDSHVAGTMIQRKARTKLSELIWIPGKDYDGKETLKSKEALKLVQNQFLSINDKRGLRPIINEILDSFYWGMTPLELLWSRTPVNSKKPSGEIVLNNILGKPFNWFAFDRYNNLGIKKSLNSKYSGLRQIPPNKIILVVRDGSYENPYGDRAVKRVYWPYIFKKNGFRFWAEFIEKYGMPYLFGRLNKKKTEAELNQFIDDLSSMVRNGVMAVRESGDGKDQVDVIESKSRGSSSDAYTAYKNAMNIEISKAILGETLTIENSETGSQAATKIHLDILDDIRDEDRITTEETFNRISKIITELNFGSDTPPPVSRLINRKEDKKEIAERDSMLVKDIGVKFKKTYISKTYEIDEDDFEISEQKKEIPKNMSGGEYTNNKFPIQSGLDTYLEDHFKNVLKVTDSLAGELKSIIEKSNNYDELFLNMISIKDKVNNKQFADIWQEILAVYDIAGEYSAINNEI